MNCVECIKFEADKQIKRYINELGYLDPMLIVKNLKRVHFSIEPLTDSINGFYNYISPNKQMIVINSNLTEEEFQFTLFHELGHYFLGHKDKLLLNSSFTMNLKEEYQADLFATYMYVNYKNIDYLDNKTLLPKKVSELKEKISNML